MVTKYVPWNNFGGRKRQIESTSYYGMILIISPQEPEECMNWRKPVGW